MAQDDRLGQERRSDRRIGHSVRIGRHRLDRDGEAGREMSSGSGVVEVIVARLALDQPDDFRGQRRDRYRPAARHLASRRTEYRPLTHGPAGVRRSRRNLGGEGSRAAASQREPTQIIGDRARLPRIAPGILVGIEAHGGAAVVRGRRAGRRGPIRRQEIAAGHDAVNGYRYRQPCCRQLRRAGQVRRRCGDSHDEQEYTEQHSWQMRVYAQHVNCPPSENDVLTIAYVDDDHRDRY